jgi:hypothetical protein
MEETRIRPVDILAFIGLIMVLVVLSRFLHSLIANFDDIRSLF